MTRQEFEDVVENMDEKSKQTAILLYLKDIKDLLESICDAKSINKKHY